MNGFLRLRQFINGAWVDLIDVEMGKDVADLEIKEAVEGLSKLSFDSNSFWMSNNKYESVVISKNQGPIKINFISRE